MGAAGLPETFEEALQVSKAVAMDTVAAAYHEKTLVPYFGEKYAEVLERCFSRLQHPDTRSFRFVAAIGPAGRALRVYAERATNIFDCMYGTLVIDIFPPPPVVPYFMHVELQFATQTRALTADSRPDSADR